MAEPYESTKTDDLFVHSFATKQNALKHAYQKVQETQNIYETSYKELYHPKHKTAAESGIAFKKNPFKYFAFQWKNYRDKRNSRKALAVTDAAHHKFYTLILACILELNEYRQAIKNEGTPDQNHLLLSFVCNIFSGIPHKYFEHAALCIRDDLQIKEDEQTKELYCVETSEAEKANASWNESMRKSVPYTLDLWDFDSPSNKVKKSKQAYFPTPDDDDKKYNFVKHNDRVLEKAIREFKTRKQKIISIIGKISGMGYALGCCLAIFAGVFLAFGTAWTLLFLAIPLMIVNAGVNWYNLAKNIVPEYLIALFGRDKLFKGIFYYYDEKGNYVGLNKKRIALTAVGLLFAVATGIAFGAITYAFIFSLQALPILGFFGHSVAFGLFLSLGISLAVVTFIAETVFMVVGIAEFMRTQGGPIKAIKAYFKTLFESNSALNKPLTIALIVLGTLIGLAGLYVSMHVAAISLTGLLISAHMASVAAAITAKVICLGIALVAQIPFVLKTSTKFMVRLSSLLGTWHQNRKSKNAVADQSDANEVQKNVKILEQKNELEPSALYKKVKQDCLDECPERDVKKRVGAAILNGIANEILYDSKIHSTAFYNSASACTLDIPEKASSEKAGTSSVRIMKMLNIELPATRVFLSDVSDEEFDNAPLADRVVMVQAAAEHSEESANDEGSSSDGKKVSGESPSNDRALMGTDTRFADLHSRW